MATAVNHALRNEKAPEESEAFAASWPPRVNNKKSSPFGLPTGTHGIGISSRRRIADSRAATHSCPLAAARLFIPPVQSMVSEASTAVPLDLQVCVDICTEERDLSDNTKHDLLLGAEKQLESFCHEYWP